MKLFKPEIKPVAAYIKFALCGILALIILIQTKYFVDAANRYRSVSANPLTVQAYITRIQWDGDSESDSYSVIMEYLCDGKAYEGKYKTFSREEDAQKLVGTAITITVDPQSPGETADDIRRYGERKLTMTALFVGAMSVILCYIPHRKSYAEAYGWYSETIKKDVIHHLITKGVFVNILSPVIWLYTFKLCFADVYLRWSFADVFALGIAALGIVQLANFIRRLNLVRNEHFWLQKDTFVSKRVEEGTNDNPDTYHVTYTNGDSVWEKSVSIKAYDAAEEGNYIESVYLTGETKPVLSYSPGTGLF